MGAEEPVASAELATQSRFGRFTLVHSIGEGGMATVYLAQLRGEMGFAKWAAVKVVHARHDGNSKFSRMFHTEARLAARIDHPNVCTVFDFGEVDGVPYLAMEYLNGQTLQKVMQQSRAEHKPVPLVLAARIIADAAQGLHAAHELRNEDGAPANVVHRDVSPQNIFVLYSGITKVMDFGVARTEDRDDDEITAIDELKGKLTYMSPEQLKRDGLDRRSDVFALGVVLWELTTGQRLFKRKAEGETIMAILQETLPLPSSLVSEYPARLERIVMQALECDPNKRFQTAQDMARELDEFIMSMGRPASAAQVAAVMTDLFSVQIEETSTSLRRAAERLREGSAGSTRSDPGSISSRGSSTRALLRAIPQRRPESVAPPAGLAPPSEEIALGSGSRRQPAPSPPASVGLARVLAFALVAIAALLVVGVLALQLLDRAPEATPAAASPTPVAPLADRAVTPPPAAPDVRPELAREPTTTTALPVPDPATTAEPSVERDTEPTLEAPVEPARRGGRRGERTTAEADRSVPARSEVQAPEPPDRPRSEDLVPRPMTEFE